MKVITVKKHKRLSPDKAFRICRYESTVPPYPGETKMLPSGAVIACGARGGFTLR